MRSKGAFRHVVSRYIFLFQTERKVRSMIQYQNKDFLTFMPDVQEYNSNLLKMNTQWDSIKLLSEINCPVQSRDILPHMHKIQNSFFQLQKN